MSARSKLWALMRGDYVSAGDLYYRDGKIQKAAALYAKAGHQEEAARVCALAGLKQQAVHYYLEAGKLLDAGELLAAEGQHKDAVPYFERAGAFWQAAESSLKLGQPVRAARYFEKAKKFRRAAECFEEAGQLEEALRCWEQESQRLEKDTSAGPEARKLRQTIDLHRSRVLARIGQLDKSAEILRHIGLNDRAARLMERAGRLDEAAKAYLDADQPHLALALIGKAENLDQQLAARIYSRSGEYLQAARVYEQLGQYAEAAEAYEAAEEWVKAGAVWEEAEEPSRAAELFYRAGQIQDAARCYAKAKDFRLAADTYAKVGDHRAAAECYTQINQPLKAAQHFLQAGDREAGSSALQQIEPTMPSYEQATLMLVPLLIEDRLYEGALHRLQLLSNQASTSTFAVERLYWEGRIHDALGDLFRAESSYQKAAALRRDHRDLQARLVSLRQRMARAGLEPGMKPLDMVERRELGPGSLLENRYEIMEEIGRGGMGRVYKARDRELDEMVAIKTLLSKNSDKLKSEERLLREVQICRRISHPNVVRVYDIGRFEGGVFVTMELLEGTTLDRIIVSGERVSLRRARDLFRDILLGLREAHGLKVIHRDLKPANVAITDGGAKIMDFGIAHVEDTDVNLTQTGQVVGSPMYMSPEQIQGFELDARSDLYSFGVLGFALLTGHEPFTGKTATAISLKHLQDQPPSLVESRPDADSSWDAFLRKLLAKRPQDRYPSADAVLEAVNRLPT